MTLWHLILLALIQGVTEFLPISSSGHLILLPALTGMDDQGIALDIALHLGTLAAVTLYFRADVGRAIMGTIGLLRGRWGADERLAAALAVATVPVVIAGGILSITIGAEALRSVAVIGWATLGFGLLLWWFDRSGAQVEEMRQWTLRQALILGLWQAVALIPGTSRSGICITGARAMGFVREDAAKISMLMSIPTILASATLLFRDVAADMSGPLLQDAAIAAVLSFAAATGALSLMMRLLASVNFTPYVIYRVFLGIGLLIWAYS